MKGKVQLERVGSLVLKGNPLGDPSRRDVPVYLPPSYGARKGHRYPVIYHLAGFTGTGRSTLNFNPWRENVAERFDRLIQEKKARECVLVFPDCFTAFGGSQYLDSPATGDYETHIVDELVPFFEDKLQVRADPAGRGVMGKSSGGYGALRLAMRRPDVFGHCVSHSGDAFFEVSCAAEFPKAVSKLGAYGSARRFVKEFLASKDKEAFDHALVGLIAMSACYSPNPGSPLGFDLPCDERTGELIPEVWRRWKEKDPVAAAPRHAAGLKKLKTLWFDAGRRDEFFLHLAARKLSDVLRKLGVKHVYEEHERGHFDLAERYEVSLPLLSRRLG